MANPYILKAPFGDSTVSESLLQYTKEELLSVFRSIKYSNLKPLSDDQVIAILGGLVDISEDLHRTDGFQAAIHMCKNILKNRNLSEANEAKVYYCLSNCHYGIWNPDKEHHTTVWDDENLTKSIYYHRKAITPELLDDLHPRRAAQVFTNFANSLSTVGRIVEAIEQWENALEQDPSLMMARGNRGLGLWKYATYYNDKIYSPTLLSFGYYELLAAGTLLHRKDASDTFKSMAEKIGQQFSNSILLSSRKLPDCPLGSSPEEKEYREWCLEKRLFLNPLNDLGAFSAAAFDPMKGDFESQSPNKQASLHGLFNQIKQEFVTARYHLYRGFTDDDVHFSDKGVLLTNTLDYPEYGYTVELLRTSIISFYSLFNRIAYFLNLYFGIGMDENDVDFVEIWNKPVDWYSDLNNFAVGALYWLHKDFEWDRLQVPGSLDPGLSDVKDERNLLEHRYVKVHWFIPEDRTISDELSKSITRTELEDYALRLAKKARAAIIYLTLAVKEHEGRRLKKGIKSPPVTFDVYEDNWKR